MAEGRPNRGSGTTGPKRPEGTGNKDQYSLGGKTSTKTSSTTKKAK